MGVTAGAVAVSPLASRVAFASGTTYTGDVLIVLSMHGGWDGLSIVPPIGDPDYAEAAAGPRDPGEPGASDRRHLRDAPGARRR